MMNKLKTSMTHMSMKSTKEKLEDVNDTDSDMSDDDEWGHIDCWKDT